MLRKTLMFLVILGAGPARGEPAEYTTSCEIRDGRGHGLVHNLGDAFEIDGDLRFDFFDAHGDLLVDYDVYEYEYVSRLATEEIDHTAAPAGAASCSFDIDAAIVAGRPEVPEFATSCEIRHGYAYGGVHNYGGAFEIEGYVWFYFMDRNGRIIDQEDEYESEYVAARSFAVIDDVMAPYSAVTCTFGIDQAIRRN